MTSRKQWATRFDIGAIYLPFVVMGGLLVMLAASIIWPTGRPAWALPVIMVALIFLDCLMILVLRHLRRIEAGSLTSTPMQTGTTVNLEIRREAASTDPVINVQERLEVPLDFASQWLFEHSPWGALDSKIPGISRTVVMHTDDRLRFVNRYERQNREYWYDGRIAQPYEVNAEIQMFSKGTAFAFGITTEKLWENQGHLSYHLTWRIVPISTSSRWMYLLLTRSIRKVALRNANKTLSDLRNAWNTREREGNG